jgi:ParB/RepB/Spo0J family partition protein
MKLPIDRIRPNPSQPRKKFVAIQELATSIKEKGLLEPILVRPVEGGFYEIIHGHRRWLAAREAGLEEIDANVRTDVSDQEAYELALVENVQREDLSPVEEAEAFRQLQAGGMTQQAIARTIGKTQSYVSHKLRLLNLTDDIIWFLDGGLLSEGHARQFLRLPEILKHARATPPAGASDWATYFQQLLTNDATEMSVRELEDRVDRLKFFSHRAAWCGIRPEDHKLVKALDFDVERFKEEDKDPMFLPLYAKKWNLIRDDEHVT